MPYIKSNKREVLDPVIEDLIQTLRGLQSDDPNDNMQANLNYVISRLFNRIYVANYQEINNALGVLLGVALEYYRRIAVPYENQKYFDEGDVYDLNTAQKVVEDFISRDED